MRSASIIIYKKNTLNSVKNFQSLNSERSKPFDTESQLVSTLLKHLNGPLRRNYRTELEVDAGVGIADVVLYSRRPRTTREVQLLAAIPPRLAPLLDPLTANRIENVEDLAIVLGLSKPAAQRVFRQLIQLNLFNTGPFRTLKSVNNRPFETIIAIEAKLSDWSRALVQAYRNRQFSDESWVVLDHRFYKAALANIDRFERSGVGLASIDLSGQLFIHYTPPFSEAMSTTKKWHAQAALARRTVKRFFKVKP